MGSKEIGQNKKGLEIFYYPIVYVVIVSQLESKDKSDNSWLVLLLQDNIQGAYIVIDSVFSIMHGISLLLS